MRPRREILDKIRACDARSGSDNPHEADTAARMSRQIRDKYGVTDEEVAGGEVGRMDVDEDAANLVTWVGASAVTGCQVVGFNGGARVVGTRVALDEAVMIVAHLTTEAHRVHSAASSPGSRSWDVRRMICPGDLVRDQFLLGVAMGSTRRMVRAFGVVVVPARVAADAESMAGDGTEPGEFDEDAVEADDQDSPEEHFGENPGEPEVPDEPQEESHGSNLVVRDVPGEPRGRPPIEVNRNPSLEFGVTAGRMLVSLPPRRTRSRRPELGSRPRPGARSGGVSPDWRDHRLRSWIMDP